MKTLPNHIGDQPIGKGGTQEPMDGHDMIFPSRPRFWPCCFSAPPQSVAIDSIRSRRPLPVAGHIHPGGLPCTPRLPSKGASLSGYGVSKRLTDASSPFRRNLFAGACYIATSLEGVVESLRRSRCVQTANVDATALSAFHHAEVGSVVSCSQRGSLLVLTQKHGRDQPPSPSSTCAGRSPPPSCADIESSDWANCNLESGFGT